MICAQSAGQIGSVLRDEVVGPTNLSGRAFMGLRWQGKKTSYNLIHVEDDDGAANHNIHP